MYEQFITGFVELRCYWFIVFQFSGKLRTWKNQTAPSQATYVYVHDLSHICKRMFRNHNDAYQSLSLLRYLSLCLPLYLCPSLLAYLMASLLAVIKFTPLVCLCRPHGSAKDWSFACWLWEPQHACKKNAHAAETVIKYVGPRVQKRLCRYMWTKECDDFFFRLEFMTCPLRVCLLSSPLTFFLTSSSPLSNA